MADKCHGITIDPVSPAAAGRAVGVFQIDGVEGPLQIRRYGIDGRDLTIDAHLHYLRSLSCISGGNCH